MEVTVEKKPKQENVYPALYITDEDHIVLMKSHETGTTISQGRSNHPLGYMSTSWAMSVFKLFDGKVTIEN